MKKTSSSKLRKKEIATLARSLEEQELVSFDKKLARKIAKVGKKITFAKNQTLIQQDGKDKGVFFIISGRVEVKIHDKNINTRGPGQHVGEMATIENPARRSASNIARAETETVFVDGETFLKLCDKFPAMWRKIAVTLNKRLRDRSQHIRVPNPIPNVFIGSSSEALTIANNLAKKIRNPRNKVDVWADDEKIFKLSKSTFNSLVDVTETFDFAILILSPDDKVFSKKKLKPAPRDNLIYELGLFTGALGCERTYFISPANLDLKLPTDLAGITNLRLKFLKKGGVSEKEVKRAADRIRQKIKEFGPRSG